MSENYDYISECDYHYNDEDQYNESSGENDENDQYSINTSFI